MIVLGINSGFRLGYQDTSACLVVDGEVVSAVEEERLNRVKFAPGQLPEMSIVWVLKNSKLSIQDVDAIAFHGSTWGEEVEEKLKKYIHFRFGYCPPIYRIHHHLAHAASAYYGSGFDSAMILTMDSSGDGVSTALFDGEGESIRKLEEYERPQSLGMFYSAMTQFCGFRRDSDEYKLMGLASYGNPEKYDLSSFLKITSHGYQVEAKYFPKIESGRPQPTRQEPLFSSQLEALLRIPPRRPEEEVSQIYKDIAASTQSQLTEALCVLVKRLHERTGRRRLCLAGGVALNCRANQELLNLDFVDEIYIPPCPGDNGISVGAALQVALMLGDHPKPLQNIYLGPSYSNSEIKEKLDLCGLSYVHIDDPASEAADLVAKGQIVGWFQGALEFGPRALGGRSILANPAAKNIRDVLNTKIKFRESFRPFCPSLREEDLGVLFKTKAKRMPYMTITSEAQDFKRVISWDCSC